MDKPFYFIVTFWGKKFGDHFCELILPSLLAPGNIPALNNKSQSRFVIVTTKYDWSRLEKRKIFSLLKTYIEPVFIEIQNPKDDDNKMLVMSRGHKIASELAFKAKSIGVFVTPDLIISDGSMKRVQEIIATGKKVVLSAAIRFEYDGSMESLRQMGHLKPDEPLILSGRDLMRATLPNFHSELKRYFWDKPYYPLDAITSIFRLDDYNCVIHTFSWGPMAIDYSSIDNHHTETFDNWTLDGDYIYANCGNNIESEIYVVTDTDELAFASFTSEQDLSYVYSLEKLQLIPYLSKIIKLGRIKEQCNSGIMDPLKIKLIRIPIFFHSDDLSNKIHNLSVKSQSLLKMATLPDLDISTHFPYIIFIKMQNFLILANTKLTRFFRYSYYYVKYILSKTLYYLLRGDLRTLFKKFINVTYNYWFKKLLLGKE